jgi:Uma2 family endonuclease
MRTGEDPQFDDWILARFLELDLPEGLQAEFINGEIVVVPPPSGAHDMVVGRIAEQIRSNCPAVDTWQGAGVETPSGRYLADLVAGPEGWAPEGWAAGEAGSWLPADRLQLVVEVTATRPEDDRGAKRLGYAAAGVPLYLLVDLERDECVLRARPHDGDYQSGYRVPIGVEIPLPQPLGFALHTDAFPK